MQRVGISLQCGLLRSTHTRGRHLGVHLRTVEQLLDRSRNTVPIQGIRVLVARYDEPSVGRETPGVAIVVVDVSASPWVDVVGPEADFVVVAGTVAILRPVKHRWCWVTHQEMHCGAAYFDRHVPMALRGKAEHVQLVLRVPVCRLRSTRVVRQKCPGHILPEEELEGPNAVGVDGEHRVHGHAELAREEPEAKGVAWGEVVDPSTVVQVEPGRDPGVRRRRVAMRVDDWCRGPMRHGQVVGLESCECNAAGVEVELIDEKHVGAHPLDDLSDEVRLSAAGHRQFGGKIARVETIQRGVEGCKLHVLRGTGLIRLGSGYPSQQPHGECQSQSESQNTSQYSSSSFEEHRGPYSGDH